MFEIVFKIWFLIAVLPLTIAQEGWAMLKKFMDKHNYHPDWAYTLLAFLIIFLFVAILLQYGYR